MRDGLIEVPTKEIASIVQKRLFELGCEWQDGTKYTHAICGMLW